MEQHRRSSSSASSSTTAGSQPTTTTARFPVRGLFFSSPPPSPVLSASSSSITAPPLPLLSDSDEQLPPLPKRMSSVISQSLRRSISMLRTASSQSSSSSPTTTTSSISRARSDSSHSLPAITSSASSAYSPDVICLARAITQNKHELIQALVQLDGDFAVRVRFVDTVDHFLLEQDTAKQRTKADKIVHIFFPPAQGDSTEDVGAAVAFGLAACVHEHTVRRLQHAHYFPHLVDARNQVLQGLSDSPLVMELVRKMQYV